MKTQYNTSQKRLTAVFQVFEQHLKCVTVLAEIFDDSARAANHFTSVAFLVDFAQTNPLA